MTDADKPRWTVIVHGVGPLPAVRDKAAKLITHLGAAKNTITRAVLISDVGGLPKDAVREDLLPHK